MSRFSWFYLLPVHHLWLSFCTLWTIFLLSYNRSLYIQNTSPSPEIFCAYCHIFQSYSVIFLKCLLKCKTFILRMSNYIIFLKKLQSSFLCCSFKIVIWPKITRIFSYQFYMFMFDINVYQSIQLNLLWCKVTLKFLL